MEVLSFAATIGTTKSPLVAFEIERLNSVRWRATAAMEWGGKDLSAIGTGDQLGVSEYAGYTWQDFPPGSKGIVELYAIAPVATTARVVLMLR